MHLIVRPAYGRTYTSFKAIKADLAIGRDFVVCNIENHGSYANIMELATCSSVEFRYDKNGEKVGCLYAKDLAKAKAAYDQHIVKKGMEWLEDSLKEAIA
jgi:hypothetical protein